MLTMGDVVFIINNTSLEKGGTTGDDEDGWNELSGSGDGDLTNFQTSWSPVRPSTPKPAINRKDSQSREQDNLWIYIIAASVVFALIIIIIVVVVICCRKRKRARRKRQKFHLPSQGHEIKAMPGNRETRVFASIPGNEAIDLQRIEHERAISRSLAPPAFIAPPPPKSRTAPEAEKLLKSGQSSQDQPQPELTHLLHSESANHYEEIGSMAVVNSNEEENEPFLKENEITSTGDRAKGKTKDTDGHEYKKPYIKPEAAVTKPKKSPRKITVLTESDGNKRSESTV
jgi:hypothetical protein